MSDISSTKFYLFLANYKSNGESLADAVDKNYGNKDGYVIKEEFRKFVKGEYDKWSGESNSESELNDIVNKYWRQFDTNSSASRVTGTKLKNLNALDKEESAALEKNLEMYVKFDQYVSNIQIPSVLTTKGNEWKKAISTELMAVFEEYVQNNGHEDIESYLDNALAGIYNKYTAMYCAAEYQNDLASTLLKDYPDYKIGEDKALESIINNYLLNLDKNARPEDIMNDIKGIVDAYFATAGIGNGSDWDLSKLGYSQKDTDKLNAIQIAVVTTNLLNEMKNDDNYENYQEYFNEAITTFAGKLTVKDFNDGSLVEKFKSSTEYKNIQIRIEINNKYSSIDENSSLYKTLAGMSTSLAETIRYGATTISTYQNILKDTADKVISGDLKMADVENYIISQIKVNLEKFYPNGFNDMSLDELNTMYKIMTDAALEIKDGTESLNAYKNAAVKYCDALNSKELYSDLVKQVFGSSDYKSVINKQLYPKAIDDMIKKLQDLAAKVKDVSKMNLSWDSSILDNYSVKTGSSLKLNVSATVSDDKSQISGITYGAKVVNGSGSVTCSELGNLTISAGSSEGYMTIEVYAYYNGKAIGSPKTITVKCIENYADSVIPNIKDWGTNAVSTNFLIGAYRDKKMNQYSFQELYESDSAIQLDYTHNDWNESDNNFKKISDRVEDALKNVTKSITSALATAGLNKTILEQAAESVINNYICGDRTYYPIKTKNDSARGLRKEATGKLSNMPESDRHKIINIEDTRKRDENLWIVNFRDIVDDILDAYYSMA